MGGLGRKKVHENIERTNTEMEYTMFLIEPVADLGFFTHQSNAEGVSHARGVRGHAPPGKFLNLDSLKCDFQHFPSNILRLLNMNFISQNTPSPLPVNIYFQI